MLDAADEERRLRLAQARFLDGHDVPAGLISDAIRGSWERLRRSGITPDYRARFDSARSAPRFDGREGEHDLITAAMPEMEALQRSLNSPTSAVLCVNSTGTIIAALCDAGRAPAEVYDPLRPGKSLRETDIGTNAPACVLADQRPVLVRRSEHFLIDLNRYVCAAAPIFGLTGELTGVLDVTGSTTNLQPMVLDQVKLAARAIENRLFLNIPNAYILELHFMRELLGTAAQGILAASEDRVILAANDGACRLLGLERDALVGMLVEDLLDGLQTLSRDSSQIFETISRLSGRRYFAREGPLRGGAGRRSLPVATSKRGNPAGLFDVPKDRKAAHALLTGQKAFLNRLPLIIRGETGTGKEVLARQLHDGWDADKPFVPINCAAIPDSLMESELFGYTDGAFTGARKGGNSGAILAANGGTLFLDEIGDAPLTLQTKLLRVLQERTVSRLGSQQEIKVDFRVVAATHRDLKAMISAGTFREDLFYRLNGLTVQLPALRERTDILDLIDTLLRTLAAPRQEIALSLEARTALAGHSWPGNIRQLRQALAAAVVLAEDPTAIALSDFPGDLIEALQDSGGIETDALAAGMAASANDLVRRTLQATNNNVSEAARRLKISRTTIYNHLKRNRRATSGEPVRPD